MKSIVSSLVVLIAVPVMAMNLEYRDRDRDRDRDRTPICEPVRIEGLITSIDSVVHQITVGDVLVQVTETTRLHMGRQIISFADLAIGQTVAVCGILDGDVLISIDLNVKYQGE